MREKIDAILEAGEMFLNAPDDLAEFIDKPAVKRSRTDQILALICEEIEKSLLTDEETRRAIGKDRKLKSVEDFRQVFADVAQAQLNKILAMLQETSTSSRKENDADN